MLSAPERELEAIQARAADLEQRYSTLESWAAYAMASAHLSDWQAWYALTLQQQGMWLLAAIHQAQQMPEPQVEPPSEPEPVFCIHLEEPAPERVTEPLPVLDDPPDLTPEERILEGMRKTLCYYALIRYVGYKGQAPVVGVAVVCPGRDFSECRWSLKYSGIPPRTQRWRDVETYLAGYEVYPPATPLQLESLQTDLDRLWPKWSRLLEVSPVYAVIEKPHAFLQELYEEHVMGQHSTQNAVVAEKKPESDSLATSYSAIANSTCRLIHKFVDQMNLEDVEDAMTLLTEQVCEDAYPTKIRLYERMIALLSRHAGGNEAAKVDRILAAAERVHRW